MSGFRKGRSGNPNGRPKGIEDKRSALRALLEPHAPKLVEVAVKKALKGDTTALRICLDRLIPTIKAKDSPVKIGPLNGTLVEQGRTVLAALTEGRVTPDEAASLMQAVASQSKIVETDELVRRVAALEAARIEQARK